MGYLLGCSAALVVDSCSLFAFIPLASALAVPVAEFVSYIDLFSNLAPYSINAVTVSQALENAITTNHDEVEVVLNSE